MNQHNARLRATFPARKRRTRPDFLLIDVSNSFTKLAFASRSRIERPSKIATPSLNARRIASILRRRDARTVVVSSVVPKKNREIKHAAGGRKIIWLTAKTRLNVRIDYPSPRSIGADRLANAVAVAELYGSPAIVIDFGTAVTFDIVSPGNAYIGGVIAPGLEAMTNFLYHRTALLPRISLREPQSAIGKSTNQAMLAGAIFGYRGLVREILQRIIAEKSWRDQVRIVATGGYAKLIARKLPEVDIIHEHLTLEGLRLVGRMNMCNTGEHTDRATRSTRGGICF
jgi:type III pantothenate kinase